jgi:hypothetical protein
MQCVECDKPSETNICCICTEIERLEEVIEKGGKRADKAAIRYDNLRKLQNNRFDH